MFSRNLRTFLLISILGLSIYPGINAFGQGEPECNCLQYEFGSADYLNCEANNECDGVNIPVNGNVWILAAAGLILFVVREKLGKKILA